MGRTALATYESVAAAADAMKAEKIDVTTRAVRERLGNTGSNGTISTHLQTWKARQEQHVISAATLPAPVQKTILDFIGVELSNARQVLESSIADLQRERSFLAGDNEKQFSELEENAEVLESLRTEIATLQGRAGQLETDLTATRDEIIRERANARDEISKERETAEAARTELAKALLRLEAMPRLENDLETVKAMLDKERAGKVAAEQAAAVAASKIESNNQRIQELVARLTKAEDLIAKLQEKIDAAAKEATTMNAVVQASQARIESAARELDDAKKAAAEAKTAAKKSNDEAAELRGVIAQMKTDAKTDKTKDKNEG